MRKLEDIRGDEAIDILADILEPATAIMSDEAVKIAARSGDRIGVVKIALKSHKKEVKEILALLEGEDPKTYEPPITVLPIKLLQVLNDPDLASLFLSEESQEEEKSSGSVAENTEGQSE